MFDILLMKQDQKGHINYKSKYYSKWTELDNKIKG